MVFRQSVLEHLWTLKENPSLMFVVLRKKKKKRTTKVPASYFTSKMDLFGNSKELQFRTSMLVWKLEASATNKGKGCYFMEKKDEVERDYFEWKSIGGKRKFRVVMVSHWLNCWVRKEYSSCWSRKVSSMNGKVCLCLLRFLIDNSSPWDL